MIKSPHIKSTITEASNHCIHILPSSLKQYHFSLFLVANLSSPSPPPQLLLTLNLIIPTSSYLELPPPYSR
ncbi:hypothetical protein L873DRAFT_1805644 [Choiromyces venosus 120613-1]|uniref:Uncharacterized protein n=1 Tax=Choiromyces venosus 120613-1 TaxID=1336337 RepID=A0A3N4JPI7_9PEZI|nr:hypothetical protein L873DRAFT_1805644 [Choiromyces venosus 120613-1]